MDLAVPAGFQIHVIVGSVLLTAKGIKLVKKKHIHAIIIVLFITAVKHVMAGAEPVLISQFRFIRTNTMLVVPNIIIAV